MNYVYYFKNFNNEIIYVGRTNNIKRRMKEHFLNGHLDKDCYDEVCSIMYAQINDSKYDTEICETLLINKYKPKYNTEKMFNEKFDKTSFELPNLVFKELFVYFLDDDFFVNLKEKKYPCYDNNKTIRERCENLIEYNLGNLKHKIGTYKYLTNSIYKNHRYIYDVIIKVYEKVKNNIYYEESNLDEPISEYDDLDGTYVAFNVDILDELHLSSKNLLMLANCGFIFRLSDNVYAIPLHTNKILETINKKY